MANTICSIITHLHTQTRAIDHSGGAGGIYVLKVETPILDDHATNGVLHGASVQLLVSSLLKKI